MKQNNMQRPQRVLQYIGNLASGGSQSMIMEVYRNIDRRKFQFDFIVDKTEDMKYEDEIKSLGGRVYILPAYRIYNGFFFRHAWRDFFKKHPEYKIIHSHVRTTASMVLKIAKRYGLKTIVHSHSISNGGKIKGKIKNFYQRNITRYSDINLACSKKAGEYLFGKASFLVLNNGIDFAKYAYDEKRRIATREKMKLAGDDFVVCQIGRLVSIKNQIFSIDIVKRIIDEKPNTKLLIVGTGPDGEKIKKHVEESGLADSVMMLGDRSDISDILQASDVFIMPSLYEGLPLALVEAQASGLPCVISDNVSDGIFNKNVSIVSLDDVNLWVRKILDYLGGEKRRNRSNILKNSFDVSSTIEQIEEIYGL